MAILLDAQELTASFGARPLFDNISFTVDAGERWAVVGGSATGCETAEWLVAAGAQVIVPDFLHPEPLLAYLWPREA